MTRIKAASDLAVGIMNKTSNEVGSMVERTKRATMAMLRPKKAKVRVDTKDNSIESQR